MFIETSAKAGHNVKVLFKKIAQALPGMDKDADAANGGAAANKSKLESTVCSQSQMDEHAIDRTDLCPCVQSQIST